MENCKKLIDVKYFHYINLNTDFIAPKHLGLVVKRKHFSDGVVYARILLDSTFF